MIVGKGGHAADVAWIAARDGHFFTHIEAFTRLELAERLDGMAYVLGMNDSHTRSNLDLATVTAARVIDPSLTGYPKVIDAGAVIGAGVVFGPGVILGRHTHINANCFLTRATLGDYVTVGPGATICGDVTIGDEAMIGAGAVISDRVTIGKGVKIGAGAVVPPLTEIPDYQTWVGVPARPVR